MQNLTDENFLIYVIYLSLQMDPLPGYLQSPIQDKRLMIITGLHV